MGTQQKLMSSLDLTLTLRDSLLKCFKGVLKNPRDNWLFGVNPENQPNYTKYEGIHRRWMNYRSRHTSASTAGGCVPYMSEIESRSGNCAKDGQLHLRKPAICDALR